jgi:hypothetical protein
MFFLEELGYEDEIKSGSQSSHDRLLPQTSLFSRITTINAGLNTSNTRGLFMGYQQRIRSSRDSGRGHGIPRHEKAKAKARRKRRTRGSYVSKENHVPTLEDVVDRTINRLRNLGNQRFALSPFDEHFSRWLSNLRDVLSEFESSPTISVDDQFVEERSQILSNIELELEERRQKRASHEEAIESLSNNRVLLERIEEEYAARTREIERRKDSEIHRLSSNVDGLREELGRIAQMKTGIFRAVSRKAKAQKEIEATQRVDSAQEELALSVQHFTAERERLRDEYGRSKQPVLEQIRYQQKEIENQEIDGSLEARRTACEAILNAVNALLQRKGLSSH